MARLAAPPPDGVTVRMYRHGLGDCLLLAFASEQEDEPYYVLIDCGLLMLTRDENATMLRLGESLKEATGGHIHLVVATHEHWDHISGFSQAKSVFQGMQFDNLWLAWTEKPGDPQARQLRDIWENDLAMLQRAVALAGKQSMAVVDGLLSFYGPSDQSLGFSAGTRAAITDLLSLVPEQGHDYLEPGDKPRALPEADGKSVPGARAYVLGPPRTESWFKRLEGKETYDGQPAMTALRAFGLALGAKPKPGDDDYETFLQSLPFSEHLQVSREKAAEMPFFADNYLDAAKDKGWRGIDHDWLGVAGELALQMDKRTNNTSLVLAFELVKSKKVLLFTGDAQVGNWLSWGDHTWSVGEGDGVTEETAAKLLERTVFYKVGHHGSHNATLRQRENQPWGLELMNRPDLMAVIPTDEEVARSRRWGRMPYPPLLRRLRERTRGRLVRADLGVPSQKPDELDDAEWQAFTASVSQSPASENPGYIDFTITS